MTVNAVPHLEIRPPQWTPSSSQKKAEEISQLANEKLQEIAHFRKESKRLVDEMRQTDFTMESALKLADTKTLKYFLKYIEKAEATLCKQCELKRRPIDSHLFKQAHDLLDSIAQLWLKKALSEVDHDQKIEEIVKKTLNLESQLKQDNTSITQVNFIREFSSRIIFFSQERHKEEGTKLNIKILTLNKKFIEIYNKIPQFESTISIRNVRRKLVFDPKS